MISFIERIGLAGQISRLILSTYTSPYIVVARLTQNIKRRAAGLAAWTPIDDNYAWARFSLQLQGWSAPRECFAIRERIRENKPKKENGKIARTRQVT